MLSFKEFLWGGRPGLRLVFGALLAGAACISFPVHAAVLDFVRNDNKHHLRSWCLYSHKKERGAERFTA